MDSLSPKGILIRCKIKVHKGIYTEYSLYLEDYKDQDYKLMSTKRKKVSAGIHYWLYYYNIEKSQDQKEDKETAVKLGKIYSNFTRNKYSLIGALKEDDGDNKSEAEEDGDKRSMSIMSQISNKDQRGVKYFDLEYNNKIIGRSRPKEMVVNMNIAENQVPKTIKLITKKPEYDEESQTYCLDFKNRAKLPSTNNIQIVDETNTDAVLLQLGKMESKYYSLDFSYPFTAFSAFGLAVSCLSRS